MSESAAPAPRRARGTIAVVASVLAVLVVAGGGFAAWRFLAGDGPEPDTVLPATTFAVLSLDLDPSGGQKIEAIKTLRKLPSFAQHAHVGGDSDLVKAVYDQVVGTKQCPGVDYARDVEPWVGQRAALAGVLVDGKPVPAFVLQSHDQQAARTGFGKLVACAKSHGDPAYGFTVTPDYVLLSDSDAHARAIAADAVAHPLSKDPDYVKWTGAAGGTGIVTGYLGPRSGRVLLSQLSGSLGAGKVAEKAIGPLQERLDSFRGAAASMRFHDSGLEVSFAGGSTSPSHAVPAVGPAVGELPSDTAAVLAASVDAQAVTKAITDGFGTVTGQHGETPQQVVRGIQQVTGLRLPDDLATLLGTSFSISLGGQAPKDLSAIRSPADVPLGLLVHGDPAKITRLIGSVEHHTGASLRQAGVSLRQGPGTVALASSPSYAGALVGRGTLGQDPTFRDAVPQAASSPSLLYLSLDNGWGAALARLARQQGGKDGAEIASDVQAVKALGLSGWTKDGDQHGLLRLVLR